MSATRKRQDKSSSPQESPKNTLHTWIAAHWRSVIVGVMALHAVLSLLLFDPKVSIGGDDSWYVLAAQDLLDGVSFPAWHGALYPIVLTPLVAVFGLAIPWFKLLSIAFTLGSIWLLGVALRRHIRPLAWALGLLLYGACSMMASLSGTTYSEPLFLLIQGWMILLVVRSSEPHADERLRASILRVVLLGFALFLLSQVRNVGYGALIAVLAYLLIIRRDWRQAAGTLGGFLLFAIPFAIYRRTLWSQAAMSFEGQMGRILQVDFYNAGAGHEDTLGMLVRIAQNANQYLSYYLLEFLGLHIEKPTWVVTILVLLLAVGLLFRKPAPNRYVWFLFIYLVSMLGVTFVTQQVSWSQYRLVIVYLPLILMYLLDRFIMDEHKPMGRIASYVAMGLGCISLISNLSATGKGVDVGMIQANLRGDKFKGLTPDWESYLRMSEWVGKHIPDSVVVACRKPNNARIYGERRFFGIFKIPSWNADTVQMYLDSNRVEYIMAGRLRRTVSQRTDDFINTIHLMLATVLAERPDYLELVYSEGSSEGALLFRIHRNGDRGSNADYRMRLESGLLIYSGNVEALHQLARLSLDEHRADEALSYTNQAIELYTADGQEVPYPLIETRGMAYYAQGDTQSAIRVFERLTAMHPDVNDLWYNLGVCYAKAGDPRAKACFARANR